MPKFIFLFVLISDVEVLEIINTQIVIYVEFFFEHKLPRVIICAFSEQSLGFNLFLKHIVLCDFDINVI